MTSRRGNGSYYNSTDNSTDGNSSEDADLMLADEDLTTGKRKKFVVALGKGKRSSCCPFSLSRAEGVCVGIGLICAFVVLLAFVIVGVTLGLNGNSNKSNQDPWENVRLPSSLKPENYNIHLTIDLLNFTVEGTSVSNINVTTETNYIIIHAKDMAILSQRVTQNGAPLAIRSNFTFEKHDFYVISLQHKLAVGTVILYMSFTYKLRNDLVGFYKSSYKDSSGSTHWLASTQFEPTDARRAFPCFDEPAMKATFSIILTHDSKLNAHSNMPVKSTATSGDLTNTTFDQTLRMSSYLVAFVVSNFSCISNSSTHINVSVCSNPDVINSTQYALEKATDILLFYETYFNISFPLPKQDLFAIPDFAAGAMENWGLVTYRETALLYNPTEDSESSKQRVAVVIAHELAHQWFGNLVTMEWWDGLWLNEGFATYTEYVGTDHTEPTFDMLDQFYMSAVAGALSVDGLNETHPIVQRVSDPDEINGLFDTISYSKGASVIRMIKSVLGAEEFGRGITYYLNAHRYGNAETSQLWAALQTQAGNVNVSAIMDTWTLQMGYPILHVNTSTGSVTQERFFYLKPNGTIASSPYNYVWMVPFNYLVEKNSSTEFVKTTKTIIKDSSTTISFPSNKGFIKVNHRQTGFYRVNYDLQNWNALIQHLHSNPNSTVLHPGDRAGLLDDAFALSNAGMLDVRMALKLSLYLKKERDFVPLMIGLSSLGGIGSLLSLTPAYGLYMEFMRNLTADLVQEYGFNRTHLDHLQTFLRSAVLSSAWFHGNKEVVAMATAEFQAWKKGNHFINADLKSVVYSVGVAYGSLDDWDYVWNQYLVTSDPHEKRLFLYALSRSRVPWILNRFLNYSITADKVKRQDSLSVISYVSRNVYGRYLAWNFVRDKWNHFKKLYGGGSFNFASLILSITSSFTTELELKEVESFFTSDPDLGSGTRAARQAIESIRTNIHWLQTNTNTVTSCLEDTVTCLGA